MNYTPVHWHLVRLQGLNCQSASRTGTPAVRRRASRWSGASRRNNHSQRDVISHFNDIADFQLLEHRLH